MTEKSEPAGEREKQHKEIPEWKYIQQLRDELDKRSWPNPLQSYKDDYPMWRQSEGMDTQMTFRLTKTDLMKLKTIARLKHRRYQTYVREILKREIRREEERMVNEQRAHRARIDRELQEEADSAG